jgi:DNA-binding NarL/FixJ family response regulator
LYHSSSLGIQNRASEFRTTVRAFDRISIPPEQHVGAALRIHSRKRAVPPRLHTVTNLLIPGLVRKQIAADVDLSIRTVNDYAQEIYVRFRVHSQAELIRRFVEGDRGDPAATSQSAS